MKVLAFLQRSTIEKFTCDFKVRVYHTPAPKRVNNHFAQAISYMKTISVTWGHTSQ